MRVLNFYLYKLNFHVEHLGLLLSKNFSYSNELKLLPEYNGLLLIKDKYPWEPNEDDEDSSSTSSTETLTENNRVIPPKKTLEDELELLEIEKQDVTDDLENLEYLTESGEQYDESDTEFYKKNHPEFFDEKTTTDKSLNKLKELRSQELKYRSDSINAIKKELENSESKQSSQSEPEASRTQQSNVSKPESKLEHSKLKISDSKQNNQSKPEASTTENKDTSKDSSDSNNDFSDGFNFDDF